MSEFPAEGGENGDMQAVMENFQKKNNLVTGRTHVSHHPQVTSSSQMLTTNQSQSSSSSRVAKSSQRILTSSSSSSEMKASSMKSDLTELKRGISEMKNMTNFSRMRSSMENLVDRDAGGKEEADLTEPLVTFPDPDTPPPVTAGSPSQLTSLNTLNNLHGMNQPLGITNISGGQETMKFEQKKMTSASKTKVVTDGFSAEKATANSAEMRALQAGDVSYKEQSAATAARARVELDGVSAEKSIAAAREQRSLKAGDLSHQESNNMAASTMKLQSDSFSSEKKAMAAQQQRQTVTSSGIFNHEKHVASSSQSSITIASKGVTSKSSMLTAASAVNQLMNGILPAEEELLSLPLDDLDLLCSKSNPQDVERAIAKYCGFLDNFLEKLKSAEQKKAPLLLNRVNEIIRKAWAVPTHGHELGYTLCNTLRTRGGLDLLMTNCVASDQDLQFSSARLLEQCLTTENRAHVVEHGLEKVVNVACVCTKNANSVDHARVGTGILEHLFKHSEGTCSDVIRLGGLDAVLFECRKNDVETLRHCAGALANLSLYGGAENQEAMIKRKVPMWLFPLAFHNDDNIKYYACLAIAVLVANKEIEAAVLKSGTLDLVEPFVTSHNPYEFAKSNLAHAHGQSKNWLERLVPVLSSKREEARNLAAFHFCMEAGIKKRQGNTEIFRAIGAIEPLKKVASCPNAIASKYAAQALRLIGEEIPHKLSQQVPLWSTEDVREWVKQIGFAECAGNFVESRVDGDLLLQLTEENLREDIGLTNGIRRRRFTRELQNLKKMADYSSRDTGNLNSFLQSIGQEFSIYTYSMLNAGVDKDSIRNLSEDQLLSECGIANSIHRLRILDAIKNMQHNQFSSCENESPDKSLDVFVSYRRSNGSQLASLLKVHLQLRGFSVFIDVERLEAGKFDNNLLQSIRQAKHFLLVLTPKALERCIQDNECKDWVHREIVAALQSQCNIIPIIDNFQWPEPEELPEDMRAVCHFNGVRWIHDYQDACVDKLERFMRGEIPMRSELSGGIPRGMASKDPTTIQSRFRKTPSPSRWLMGLPPASPRVKFLHGHPGESPVPRRPCNSSSTRSKSLELLDKEEEIESRTSTANRESPTRPRSRSLDGFLDEDLPTEDSQSINVNGEVAVEWAEGSENLDKRSMRFVQGSSNLEKDPKFVGKYKNFETSSREFQNLGEGCIRYIRNSNDLQTDPTKFVQKSKSWDEGSEDMKHIEKGSTIFNQGCENLNDNCTKLEHTKEGSMDVIKGLKNVERSKIKEFQESDFSKENTSRFSQASDGLGWLNMKENQGVKNLDEAGIKEEQKNGMQNLWCKSKERESVRKDSVGSNGRYQKVNYLEFSKNGEENKSKPIEEENILESWRASKAVQDNNFIDTNIGEFVSGQQEAKFVASKPRRNLNNPLWKISPSKNSIILNSAYTELDKSVSELCSEQCLGDSTSINSLYNPQPLPRHRNRGIFSDNLESSAESNSSDTENSQTHKHQQYNLQISSEGNYSDTANIKKCIKGDKLKIPSEENDLETSDIKKQKSEENKLKIFSEENTLNREILKRDEILSSNMIIPSEENHSEKKIHEKPKTPAHNLKISSDTEVPPRDKSQLDNLKLHSVEDCLERKAPRRPPKGLRGSHGDKRCIAKARSCGAGLDVEEDTERSARDKVQGSLLSLPAGAEPKRKRNFMDKCVNKVRAFMRK
ncbi:hypothetical protein KM043_015740 [Ampulex compressa]|nr:hypothetical protein KM043_015740 [Ampulex compressa]